MSQYPGRLALLTFSATTGQVQTVLGQSAFRFTGVSSSDEVGWPVSAGGDINGDGNPDLLIGARSASPNGPQSGAVYIVFPTTFNLTTLDAANAAQGTDLPRNINAPDPASDGKINLSDLSHGSGFTIGGSAGGDYSGWSVASVGDVNGDGRVDVLIGAPYAAPHGTATGAGYLVFGGLNNLQSLDAADGAADAHIALSQLSAQSGIRFSGVGTSDVFGYSVCAVGDVSGDGLPDFMVGAPLADRHGNDSGAAYLVFGGQANLSALDIADGATDGDIDVAQLTPGRGYVISGAAAGDNLGAAVAGARDVNGDGVPDLVIGAVMADPHGTNSGAAYVVFGGAGRLASLDAADGSADATIDVSRLNGSNGFRISGVSAGNQSGWSVASAGDINGDGYADIAIGAPFANPVPNSDQFAGAAYVVFGAASGFSANIDLSALVGTNGFKISGSAFNSMGSGDAAGLSVAPAGDVNGDGIDDLIVGAPGPEGNPDGTAYVIFGRTTGFEPTIGELNLNGSNGFAIVGQDERASNFGVSVAAAGDVNNDGLSDLLVGAKSRNAAYLVEGLLPDSPVHRTGTNAAQSLVGGNFEDILRGLGGLTIYSVTAATTS